jgi:small-conductance mechanosensitive channel
VPLSYFIEKPFQNWTREGSALIGTAMIYVDYHAPVGLIRDKLAEIVKNSEHWDQRVVKLQVTDIKEQVIELRCMMSARTAGHAFELRCEVREKLVDFLQKHHPEALPHSRQISFSGGGDQEQAAKQRAIGRGRAIRRPHRQADR